MLYFCSKGVKEELIEVLDKYNLPTSYEFDKEMAFKYITMDKKSIGDFINIVYCESIGAFEILKIHKDEIKKLLGGSNE